MIHSLAGGEIKDLKGFNFVLVEIEDTFGGRPLKLWYLFSETSLLVGDRVIVPLGEKNIRKEGVVLRVETNLVRGRTPVPINQAKYIIDKL